eukprot:CAMPEP_0119109528 /NCGR_PEP_ID=MMETSP1180-20130426/19633_1 /TAXON_ID=3052 ORGANISM="Chlamydomonas cf sp, Strain CCMP681" /NCGR_SAMPLE_ID=MMETSP1180 /ASSEMBLY_ACC=CAM_ASM_000741 /LENGTH=155 /DNA_ID=CAMNT_0007095337 /DNA_START=649 /DNA_END=1116 /DNA_ORIENTATION=+
MGPYYNRGFESKSWVAIGIMDNSWTHGLQVESWVIIGSMRDNCNQAYYWNDDLLLGPDFLLEPRVTAETRLYQRTYYSLTPTRALMIADHTHETLDLNSRQMQHLGIEHAHLRNLRLIQTMSPKFKNAFPSSDQVASAVGQGLGRPCQDVPPLFM